MERYAVIKEATGNTATAFLAGLLFILVGRSGNLITVLPVTIAHSLLVVAAAAILIAASRRHAEKEYRYMEDVVTQGRSNERNLA